MSNAGTTSHVPAHAFVLNSAVVYMASDDRVLITVTNTDDEPAWHRDFVITDEALLLSFAGQLVDAALTLRRRAENTVAIDATAWAKFSREYGDIVLRSGTSKPSLPKEVKS